MKKISYKPFLSTAIKAARLAGRYQMRHFGKAQKITYKGAINLVTDIDKQSEMLILKTLRSKYPDHDYMTEETDIDQKGKAFRWIIDPLDGTTNYAHGYPCFCVSIGLEARGKVRVGVVYDPFAEELFYAVEGHGAWLKSRRGTKRLHVSGLEDIEKSLLVTGFPYTVREEPEPHFGLFEHFILRCQGVRRDGAAALNMSYVAAGRFDAFWELNLRPWDTAAGLLMVREAGGKATDFEGNPYVPALRAVVSSNGKLHKTMLRHISGVLTSLRAKRNDI